MVQRLFHSSRPAAPFFRSLFWLAASLPIPIAASAFVLEGYPTETSVVLGNVLELHVRSDLSQYHISIWRQGRNLEKITDVGDFWGSMYPPPDSAWAMDNAWPITCRFPIPAAWRSGAYAARLSAGTSYRWIPFVVRQPVPGAAGPILVQLSINTWQAYNTYGGKSLYGSILPGIKERATRLTLHRPYDWGLGAGHFFLWEAPFISFLEAQGYAYEVCTNVDVHRDPSLLRAYKVFLSLGHDEYYSKEMYDALEQYVDGGGNLAFFSGNTLWWQVRFEDQEHTMVCFKSARLDPLTGVDNARVTVNWHASPVLRPPARLMGIYFNYSSVPAGAYKVVDPRHWVFRGIAVDSGQVFGFPMVAYEVDSRSPDSPAHLDLIARTELRDLHDSTKVRPAEVTYYERTPAYGFPGGHGGQVFAGGTVNWVQGLVAGYNLWTKTVGRPDPVALTVTRNVLDRLGCLLRNLRLAFPADGAEVHAPRVLLQWYPAVAQRPDLAVRYEVHWQGGGSSDSLSTTKLSAWMPVVADSVYHWWVQASCECGAGMRTPLWALQARVPVDSEQASATPLLRVQVQPERMTILISPGRTSRGSVRIFDVAGRIVRSFENQSFAPPTTRLTLELRSGGARTVPSGIYFVQALVGSRRALQRVPLVH